MPLPRDRGHKRRRSGQQLGPDGDRQRRYTAMRLRCSLPSVSRHKRSSVPSWIYRSATVNSAFTTASPEFRSVPSISKIRCAYIRASSRKHSAAGLYASAVPARYWMIKGQSRFSKTARRFSTDIIPIFCMASTVCAPVCGVATTCSSPRSGEPTGGSMLNASSPIPPQLAGRQRVRRSRFVNQPAARGVDQQRALSHLGNPPCVDQVARCVHQRNMQGNYIPAAAISGSSSLRVTPWASANASSKYGS